MSGNLKISFGMIVFNGDTFLREVLESIYDFAFEIIIVEGPDQNALPMAGPDGASRDRTMEIIENFPDPLKKIRVIRGIWENKDQQSNRFIIEATGDYIWQVDDDEVYKPEDLQKIEELLLADPKITAVSFYWQNFFKTFDRVMVADAPYEVWRLFRLKPGYVFKTHRPPTVIDPVTGMEMNSVRPLRGAELANMGIYIYHYSYMTDRQVFDKIKYHSNYRLREAQAGIPAIALIDRSSRLQRIWKRLWQTRILLPLRKRMDKGFNYSYVHQVWRQWDVDPIGVEESMGISPSPGPYRRTQSFTGSHPKSMSERVSNAKL
jgi:glycosyltransferase involved in cell wall biosynthesis